MPHQFVTGAAGPSGSAQRRLAALPDPRLQRRAGVGGYRLVSATAAMQVLCGWRAWVPPLKRTSSGGA